MKQFNASEVHCNGIGGYGYQAARQHSETILSIVKEVRNNLGIDAIWQKIMELDGQGDYHQGRRFLDIESNATRLITGLGNYCYSYLESEELIEMHLGAILSNLTLEEKTNLVVDACRDCAGADHWYTFEKQWD